MNAVQRFFRRYIFSTVGIVILFFVVNIALLVVIILTQDSMSGADNSFSVRRVFGPCWMQDEKWVGRRYRPVHAARTDLPGRCCWTKSGDVVWQQDLPEKLPRSYTSAEVASFSRWYLEDYPVKIWTRADGALMVVGFAPERW